MDKKNQSDHPLVHLLPKHVVKSSYHNLRKNFKENDNTLKFTKHVSTETFKENTATILPVQKFN